MHRPQLAAERDKRAVRRVAKGQYASGDLRVVRLSQYATGSRREVLLEGVNFGTAIAMLRLQAERALEHALGARDCIVVISFDPATFLLAVKTGETEHTFTVEEMGSGAGQ